MTTRKTTIDFGFSTTLIAIGIMFAIFAQCDSCQGSRDYVDHLRECQSDGE